MFFNERKFLKIRTIFDIKNRLWKCNFGTHWWIFFSFKFVDSWLKILLFRTHLLWNSITELILLCMSRKFRHIIVQPFRICSENLTTRNDIRWSQLLLRAIPTGILLKIRCRLVHWQNTEKEGALSIREFLDQNSYKNYCKIFVKILEGFSEKTRKSFANKWPIK